MITIRHDGKHTALSYYLQKDCMLYRQQKRLLTRKKQQAVVSLRLPSYGEGIISLQIYSN